jgi:hypothetical protein
LGPEEVSRGIRGQKSCRTSEVKAVSELRDAVWTAQGPCGRSKLSSSIAATHRIDIAVLTAAAKFFRKYGAACWGRHTALPFGKVAGDMSWWLPHRPGNLQVHCSSRKCEGDAGPGTKAAYFTTALAGSIRQNISVLPTAECEIKPLAIDFGLFHAYQSLSLVEISYS